MLSVSVPDLETLRILIVDDSEDDALLMQEALCDAGLKPTTHRVETAEAMRRALGEEWDLIISDHRMPRFSSLGALEVLKSSGRDIPLIIVSGDISKESALSAMQHGSHVTLSKGNLARLAPVVKRELYSSRSHTES